MHRISAQPLWPQDRVLGDDIPIASLYRLGFTSTFSPVAFFS